MLSGLNAPERNARERNARERNACERGALSAMLEPSCSLRPLTMSVLNASDDE